jgi:hypothetical protein
MDKARNENIASPLRSIHFACAPASKTDGAIFDGPHFFGKFYLILATWVASKIDAFFLSIIAIFCCN